MPAWSKAAFYGRDELGVLTRKKVAERTETGDEIEGAENGGWSADARTTLWSWSFRRAILNIPRLASSPIEPGGSHSSIVPVPQHRSSPHRGLKVSHI